VSLTQELGPLISFSDNPGRDLYCAEPGCEWWCVTVYTEAQQDEIIATHRAYHEGKA
jgi:hypothetical protein